MLQFLENIFSEGLQMIALDFTLVVNMEQLQLEIPPTYTQALILLRKMTIIHQTKQQPLGLL